MDNIEFNEENSLSPSAQFVQDDPKMVQMLIKWGLAKDANSANIILTMIAVLFFATSIFFLYNTFKSPPAPEFDGNPLSEDFLL